MAVAVNVVGLNVSVAVADVNVCVVVGGTNVLAVEVAVAVFKTVVQAFVADVVCVTVVTTDV